MPSYNDLNKFAVSNPHVNIPRSRFDMSSRKLTTFDAGQLIPVYFDGDILPGDTISIDMASVVRMTTPFHAVMDNAFMDVFFFIVPYRLVWSHFREFMGENNSAPWANNVEYEIPQKIIPSMGFSSGSIGDYLGVPINVGTPVPNPTGIPITISDLPFRAYALIWNEWFRDQNTMSPCKIPLDESSSSSIMGNNKSLDMIYNDLSRVNFGAAGGFPLPVSKFHDLFTSALPEPQKGDPVELQLIQDGRVPVYATRDTNPRISQESGLDLRLVGSNLETIPFISSLGATVDGLVTAHNGTPSGALIGQVTPSNLQAIFDGVGTATINELRMAFAVQRMLELDARGGTRYTEIVRSHFGVISPDARLQRPEYLGGKRIPISIAQVLQTSETSSESPLGHTGAYSLTHDADSVFTYSSTEHCMLFGLVCVRTQQTYSQGLERFWTRKSRYDFYDPVFANIGEQPIRNDQLYLSNDANVNMQAFGFSEAWAEYRMKPSLVTGQFRPDASNSLDVWHYGVDFTSTPTLSDGFIAERPDNINRTLTVDSSLSDQFIADFFFKVTMVRPMPLYSIPGMMPRF